MSQKNGITPQKLLAIDLLVQGKSITDVSSEIGIARETLSRWKGNDSHFISALLVRQSELWDVSGDQLRSNLIKAAKRLEKLVEHEDPAVALKAIEVLHKSLGSYPHNGRVKRQSPAVLERLYAFSDW